MNIKELLIKFQEWQLEKKPLNANFAHNGVANLFLDDNKNIPDVIVAFCPKCKSTHIKVYEKVNNYTWRCWDCSNVWEVKTLKIE